MQKKLLEILSNYSLEDAIKTEEKDRQFQAIKKIFEKLGNSPYFLSLIIANSLIGYQLSGTGEDYREEFADFIVLTPVFFKTPVLDFSILFNFFSEFLPQSKGNKRLLNMKIPRISKSEDFFMEFVGKEKYYYENLLELQNLLAKKMKQNKNDKTILFALKMFHYGARLKFKKFILAPFEIGIPLDSRLAKLEKIYNNFNLTREDFWLKISQETKIPRLHLDAILWTKCNDFICF